MMNKENKQKYIKEMTTQFDKSEAVIVAHYQGLTVSQLDDLRKRMREHGIIFKVTKTTVQAIYNVGITINNFLRKKFIK